MDMKLISGKRLPICSEEQNKKTKQRLLTPPYLPDELIINDILIRLPARTLGICSCLSKSWYNSIFHDPKFVSSHLVHSKNKLNLVFNLLNAFEKDWQNYFFSIHEKTRIRMLVNVTCGATSELVGYCNGLACLKSESSDATADDESEITIINPTRDETLSFYSHSTPPTMGCKYLCHGFGFDSALQEYKAVFVYTNINEEEEEFVCMVITLGGEDNSWRKIVTSTSRISPPPGSSAFPGRMFTRASTITRRSATLCGSGFFWRITNRASNNNDYDMLLSFDIHSEKINFIRLPTECCLTHTMATTEIDKDEYLVVDHHLLEFQGDLCVARTEKIMISNSSDRHQQHRNHHRCKGSRKGTFCCCGFKVHLYIMNDKIKQVWTKGKTFDFPLKDGLLPDL
ncbi:F-box protein CPR1-like [Papaver somniferum]|uniref:F-box protein CPR1-like n=1 Tax=Papaver somniferum TaxID=3469 RepID=UPI000E6FF1F2|nr:F-box protein CPR1-like [Papaver somniferum]